MNKLTKKQLDKLVSKVLDTYEDAKAINHIEGANLPNRKKIYDILDRLFWIIFPGYIDGEIITKADLPYYIGDLLNTVYLKLTKEVERSFFYVYKKDKDKAKTLAQQSVLYLLDNLSEIREVLKTDVAAAFAGDPAAGSFDEIILSYPCIEAIATYRIAHKLYEKDVALIPRIMCERAHSHTGIDIHPGAKIGPSFFIDHGTGVVIGETTVIGKNVKIYQGVTIGALSFNRDKKGRIVKGTKRHPTIQDNVTIYAGATILGGKTVIGKGAVIGGNVWVTKSVPENTKIVRTQD